MDAQGQGEIVIDSDEQDAFAQIGMVAFKSLAAMLAVFLAVAGIVAAWWLA
jgi:hypothetical protein